MKKKRILAVFFAIFLITIWWIFRTPSTPPKDMGAPIVKVGKPFSQMITEWDEYTGRFQATQHVEVHARVSGYLQEIRFKDGQSVEQGQTLFIIDPRPFKIALDRAEANVSLAEKELERAKKLLSTRAFSQEQVDQRTQTYLNAKASLEEAKLNLEFSEVKAPIAGHIGRTLIDAGNLVTGGGSADTTLLTTVVADDPIYFYFEVSEQDILKYMRLDKDKDKVVSVKNTRPVQVKLQDEETFFHHGIVDFVDNEIDRSTGTLQVRAVLANPRQALLPGFFGRLRIAASDVHEAFLIPDEAVATNQDKKIVFKVNAANVVEPHQVELGPLYEGKWRVVRSGLKADDKIVWMGLAKVRPGLTVKPQLIEQVSNNQEKKAPK